MVNLVSKYELWFESGDGMGLVTVPDCYDWFESGDGMGLVTVPDCYND